MSDKSEVNTQPDPNKEEAEKLKNQANDHFKSIDHTTFIELTLKPNLKY